MDTATRVIRPNDRLSEGLFTSTCSLGRELIQHREHIYAAFVQDFRNLSHGTFFGVAWNFILPLVPIAVYMLLAHHSVLPRFPDVHGPSYVALGAAIWFLLAGCIQQPLQVVRARNSEAMKTALPLSVMVASTFAQVIYDSALRLAVVAVVVAIAYPTIRWSVLLVPFILIPTVMMFLGLGLILSVANVIYADVGRITSILIQYGLLLSGVIFPVERLPLGELLAFNPAYVLIEAVRTLTFKGLPNVSWEILACAVLGVALFMYGCRIFYLMEYRIRGVN